MQGARSGETPARATRPGGNGHDADKNLLRPLRARLRLWACEYDTVGECEDLALAAEFVDWFRVELATPKA